MSSMLYKELADTLDKEITHFFKSKRKKDIHSYRVLMGRINQDLFLARNFHEEFINISKMADQEYDLHSDFITALKDIQLCLKSIQ